MNNSFVEISSVFIKDTNSLVHIYKHEKTDFRVLYFENNDEEYIMLVAKACLGAYISYICHVKNDEDKHRAIDNTYKLFVKALN